MKTGVCFNLFRHIKKHFLFITFSFMFFIYLSFIIYVKDNFLVNASSKFDTNIVFLSVIIYIVLLGIYFTKYLYKLLPKEKYWLITTIKIVFCLLLAYLLYKYLVIFHFLFSDLSESFSYIWNTIVNKLNSQNGTKRQLLNPTIFEFVFSIITLMFFVCVIWTLVIEISPINLDFSKNQTSYVEDHIEINLSLGFLYKALP